MVYKEITQAIKSRDRLLKVAKKSNLSTDWANFKKAKNEVTKLMRKSKETYFKSKVTENRHNPCKLWHLIKGLSKEGDDDEGIQRLGEGEEISEKKKG